MGFGKTAAQPRSDRTATSTDLQFKIKYPRLIVRNLPFSVREPRLRKLFNRFGEVSEIRLVEKSEGVSAGYCFVRFSTMESAEKCVAEGGSGLKLGGRLLGVDWSLPKNFYERSQRVEEEEVVVEEEKEVVEEVEVVKRPPADDTRRGECFSSGSLDVQRKETVFVRNLALETHEEVVFEAMSAFGRVLYVKLVRDKLTARSKGCAFVRFMDADSAAKAVAAASAAQQNPITVDAREVTVSLAIPRSVIDQQRRGEKQVAKAVALDKRNLCADQSIMNSASEKERGIREALEQEKREKLGGGSKYFSSQTRLALHNLPRNIDEPSLKRVALNACGDPNARITECRVMKEKKADGTFGRSLGYAFVCFESAEHARVCMQNLDGNEKVFGAERRPVVDYSVENRSALALKKARAFRLIEKEKAIKTKKPTIVSATEQKMQRKPKNKAQKKKR